MICFISVFCFAFFYADAVQTYWSARTFHENVQNMRNAGVSLTDSLLHLTGGMLPIHNFSNIADQRIEDYPIKWLVIQFLILYFTCEYARSDLSGGGVQILSRIHNRTLWWIAKCIWNFITVLSCFAVLFLTWFILAACFHIPFTSSIDNNLFSGMFYALPKISQVSGKQAFLIFFLLPVLTCSSISLIEMTLTLYVRPVIAYILCCIYYLAGMFLVHPLFLTNYSMSIRSSIFAFYRFTPAVGLGICLILMLLSIIIGIIHLSKMDLLDTTQMKYTRSWL